jgi:ATP-binding cassette subfamily F protein uup
MGELLPDTGKIQVGETVVFGYYSQEGMVKQEDKRVIEVVREIADVIPMADGRNLSASGLLQMFLFPPDMQYTPVAKLSGGEKRRLYLLTVLMKNPNFLILDEPTNDLDIQTLNILQDFLEHFSGCVLIVTHDRYFMDSLADHLFVFDGSGNISDFNGNYTDYRQHLTRAKIEPAPVIEIKSETVAPVKQKTKASFKEVHEFGLLEKEISDLEMKIKVLHEQLNRGLTDHHELSKIAEEAAQSESELEVKTNRWLVLAEKMEL